MTLATIMINDEVRNHTDLLIKKSTYQSLRQYILDRKPLETVNEAIDSLLLEEFKKDKLIVTQQLKNDAFEQQQAKDLEEAQLDTQEQAKDQLLKENLSHMLPELERNKSQVEIKYLQQENKTNQINHEVNDLQARIKSINNSIDQVRLNRQLVITQIPYTYTPFRTHYHYHCHQYPTSIYSGYPVIQQASWAYSLNEEANLNSEVNRLADILADKAAECRKERLILNDLLNEKNSLEQQIQNNKSQLSHALPNKEHQRQIRNQERNARALARTNDSNNLQQLSCSTSEQLKKKTTEKILDLSNSFNELKHKSRAIGFATYLNQLNVMLESPQNDQITFSERNALKKMVTMMHQYIEMTANHNKITSELSNERDRFKDLQSDEKKIKEQIKDSIWLHSSYVNNLTNLSKEKKDLQQQIGSASTIRTSMLFTAMFGLSSGAVSLGLIIAFTANPLLFIIPAALALITVVALGVAVGYHWHKSQKEKLLNSKTELSIHNETNISNEDRKSTELNQTILPGVIQRISLSDEQIKELDAQLQQQQQEMNTLIKKIENISPAKAGNASLFSSNLKSTHNIDEQHEELSEYQQLQAS